MTPSLGLRIILWAALVITVAACSPPFSAFSPTASPEQGGAAGDERVGPMPEYKLSLALDTTDRRLVGRQQVAVPNHTGVELSEVVLRLYPNLPQYGGRMDVDSVWVDNERARGVLRGEDTVLSIPLAQPLPAESSVTISMTFDVDIPQRDGGYVLFGYSQGIWSLPDAYPLLAVHDGTTWHEDVVSPASGIPPDAVFADAAQYDVTLTLPSDLTLASSGSVVDETTNAAGLRVYEISGGPLREFTWLASSDYLVAETTAHGTTVRSFYLPGDEAAGQAALNTGAAALRIYADAFGPYPYPELSVAEAPLRFYGMEYPGLNLIGVDLYRDFRQELEMRVAHEVGHQWWYNQVGSDQINTPWLDEGLTEYSTATYYGEVYGQARANTLINQRWLVPYQSAVENELDVIVNQPAADLGGLYEVTVYAKAALFFDALRREVGDETFGAILREYVTRFRWRIATPDDFLQVAESVSGEDLDSLFNQWILSSK